MKTHYIITIAAIGLFAGACRKERTCECSTKETVVRTGFGAKNTEDISTSKYTKAKQKKESFKYGSACFSETTTYENSGGNGTSVWNSITTEETTCVLK